MSKASWSENQCLIFGFALSFSIKKSSIVGVKSSEGTSRVSLMQLDVTTADFLFYFFLLKRRTWAVNRIPGYPSVTEVSRINRVFLINNQRFPPLHFSETR